MLASTTFFLLVVSLVSFTPAFAASGDGMHALLGYRRHQYRRIHGHLSRRNTTIPVCPPHIKLNTTNPTTPTTISSADPQPTNTTSTGTTPPSTGPRPARPTHTSSGIDTVSKPVGGGKYKLKDSHHGNSFFDGFQFYSGADYTNGLVNFLGQSDALNKKLAYVEDNGVVVMKVDDSTPGSRLKKGKRDSVRITSKTRYSGGLFVLDIAAMPYGNSVWPAFWTVGDGWPHDGEIDIIEGINMNTKNQYTIHTAPGCSIDVSTPVLAQGLRANIGSKDCHAGDGHNGCSFFDSDDDSYGEGFNKAGGGVFVMQWESNGIKIWRFPPNQVPDDLKRQEPNPDSWSNSFLRGHWASSTCDIKRHFQEHTITFDITLCGDWAGSAYKGGKGACAGAIRDPSNFKNAAWKVNSLQIYQ